MQHMPEPGRIGLIFDMDNTLLGSRIDFPAIRRALGALLRAAGAADEPDDALMRRPLAQLVALGTAHDRACGTDLAAEMWQIIEAHEIEGLREARPLDGAPEVLAVLRARGFRIAVVTNNARAAALRALAAAALLPQTEALVARDDVPAMKPAGDGVAEAVRRLGGLDRWYVIGDSWIDGAAAAEAGGRFIAYRRPEEELRERGVRPWRAISHLSELLSIDLGA
jgi:phosphoglycolate phosphatase